MGYPHPDILLAQLSSSQLTEWMVYAAIEPFGEFRGELRHGQMMALHANINRDIKKHKEPYQPIEFMNFMPKPEPKPEDEYERIDREVFGL